LGLAGIPNFGKALFVGAGASFAGAFSGYLSTNFFGVGIGKFISSNQATAGDVNTLMANNVAFSLTLLVISLAVAGAVGLVFGLITSAIASRLKEVYLAMIFFAFAQVFQLFASNYTPLVNGTLGVEVADPFAWAGDYRFIAAVAVLVLFAVAAFALFNRLTKSPLGRMLRAVRENEIAAEVYGKRVSTIRVKVVAIASIVSAMTGALYIFYTADVIGGSFDNTLWTFWPWVMVIMGGAGNNFGTIAGAGVFWTLLELLDIGKYSFSGYIPFQVIWLQYILNGALLIFVLRIKPGGLVKEKISYPLEADTRRIASGILAANKIALPPREEHAVTGWRSRVKGTLGRVGKRRD
ncbi:MAG TPA: branched-chain amino acid ABC transporter permease, partial [Nitrososphaerales archaeon]|nr:branched-chain amino acid ABC transporter permease [Nitrososphaerales archaeon]